MSSFKDRTIADSYDTIVKRTETYAQTGTRIMLMTDTNAAEVNTGLFLEGGGGEYVGIGKAVPTSRLEVYHDAHGEATPLVHIENATSSAANSNGLLVSGGNGNAAKYSFRAEKQDGTVSLFVAGDGHVGMGTASPGTTLHVATGDAADLDAVSGYAIFGASAGNHIAIDNDSIQAKSDATTADYLILNEHGGNVGIGTNAPASETAGVLLHIADTGGTNPGILNFTGGTGGTGSVTGRIQFSDKDDTDSTLVSIVGSQDGAGTPPGGKLSIGTQANGGALTTRLTILESGNVGIGTAGPVSTLDVVSALNDEYAGKFYNSDSGDSFGVYISAGIDADDKAFYVQNRAKNNDILTCLGDGNVGMGTAVPETELHVNDISAAPVLTLTHSKSAGMGNTEGCGSINFGGTDDETTIAEGKRVSFIDVKASGDWDGDNRGTSMRFGVTTGTTTSDRLKIEKSGDVYMSKYANGSVTFSGATGLITTDSDKRMKKDINTITVNGLSKVNALNPVTYKWRQKDTIDGSDVLMYDTDGTAPNDGVEMGFIAQEVAEIIPQASPDYGDDRQRGLYDRPIIAILVKAVQELSAKVEALEGEDSSSDTKIAALEAKDTASEAKIVALEAEDVANKAKVATLETEDVANKAKIVALEAKDTEYATTITALTARITALESA